jgi:hypothetical protein
MYEELPNHYTKYKIGYNDTILNKMLKVLVVTGIILYFV